MARPGISKANAAYESWLRAQLRGELVKGDLPEKHDKMSSGPFPFLRATYWRWAETILDACPELRKAPQVLAIGDIHLENFGTWRDEDGRLVWGVNDFDEAAVMPYALDLVRLAASATLALPSQQHRRNDICSAILDGYRKGLKKPRPFVMDEKYAWLRSLLAISEKKRASFWAKVAAAKPSKKPMPKGFRAAIATAMPEAGVEIGKFYPRSAGTGSLGRPRWVGVADWRGGLVLREVKALVPSGWTRAMGVRPRGLRVREIANGRYRAPDPTYFANDRIVVRRLSPNTRKIEIEDEPHVLLDPRMLQTMGRDLANIHLGTGDHRRAIERDLAKRKNSWLQRATAAAVKLVEDDFKQWRRKRRR